MTVSSQPPTEPPGHTADTLPHALDDPAVVTAPLAGPPARHPAVFLDYDGVLTPIVPRPEDAVMGEGMREIVRALAVRCTVCVVSGRDRGVVTDLMGVDDLIVAGSHGFDIHDPRTGPVVHEASKGWEDLVAEVTERVTREAAGIGGTQVEPKHASVALHYRHVDDADVPRVEALVTAVLEEHPDQLKVTPGKFVHEIQPKIDWNKGKAVAHLLDVLELAGDDVLPIYLGDDVTDEDAFRALAARGNGVGILVIDPADAADRETTAGAVLASVDEVGRFLDRLARP